MAGPTRLGEELDPWRGLAHAPITNDCTKHPGQHYATCTACAVDAEQRILRERRAEVLNAAEERVERLFPRRYADAYTDNADILAWVDAYIDKPDDAPSLLLVGPTGTGKTWQAYGALRRAVTYPRPTRGVGFRCDAWEGATYADILAMMRPSSKNDAEEVLKRLRNVPLLFIDDLGVAKNSEWVEDVTYRLINGRYVDMRPTIYTTNLPVSELKDVLGDRIASRLAESCTRVLLTGADRRRVPKEA